MAPKTTDKIVIFCTVLALVAFASTAVDAWFMGFDWHDQQRVGQLFMLLVFAVLAFFINLNNVNPRFHVLLFVLLALGLISSVISDHPLWAIKEWGRYASLVILVLVLATVSRNFIVSNVVFFLLVFVSLVLVFMFLLYYLVDFVSQVNSVDSYLFFYGFDNPRFHGQFQVLLLPILISLFLLVQSARRWALFGLCVAHWCIAFSLGGRGALAALVVAHLCVLVVDKKYLKFVIWQLVAMTLGITLFLALFFLIPSLFDIGQTTRVSLRSGLSAREVIWGIAAGMALDNPWLGIGPLHFSATWNHLAAHPHQVILQWLAEWGVAATLIAIILGCWGVFCGARYIRDKPSSQLDAGLWVAIVAALVLAQVDGVFVMPYTEGWLAILIGVAFSRWSVDTSPSSVIQRSSFRVLSVAAMVILAQILLVDVPVLKAAQQQFYEEQQIGSPPRFWGQGWIPM